MVRFIWAIITLPFKAVMALYNRWGPGGCIVVAIILLLAFGGYKLASGRAAYIAEISQPPTSQEAPWVALTDSRAYYVQKYHMNGTVYVLDAYYGQDGYRWKLYTAPLPLTRAYGKVEVRKR
jgi:hypothetical protein